MRPNCSVWRRRQRSKLKRSLHWVYSLLHPQHHVPIFSNWLWSTLELLPRHAHSVWNVEGKRWKIGKKEAHWIEVVKRNIKKTGEPESVLWRLSRVLIHVYSLQIYPFNYALIYESGKPNWYSTVSKSWWIELNFLNSRILCSFSIEITIRRKNLIIPCKPLVW